MNKLAIAVDLEDAYKRVQFKLLMELLVQYGVGLTLTRQLAATLQERKVTMWLGNWISTPQQLTMGLPQGSPQSSTVSDLPTHQYLTVFVRKLVSSTNVCVYFSKCGQKVSRKYGNHGVVECKFIASEVDHWIWWSYCLLTFAYVKPFPGLKYTADPDWSKKFLNWWTSTFYSKFYGS